MFSLNQLYQHVRLGMRGIGSLTGADRESARSIFTQDARILFQGDSITDGNRGRDEDPNHILGHGYQFIISARYGAQLAERNLTFINRGISGNTVSDLAGRWKLDTLELKPDVLSILVGINDLFQAVALKTPSAAEQYEKKYDELLACTVAALPTARLVLGQPFTLPTGPHATHYSEWVAELK